MKQLPLAMRLRERAVFDSFVAGPNLAVVAQLRAAVTAAASAGADTGADTGAGAEASAEASADTGAGVAAGAGARVHWICGPPGSGKSHLLQASCTLARAAAARALYLPLSQLREWGPAALAGWQEADLVAVDELEQVTGERLWEEALFALYRALEERGAALIAAAAAPPGQLPFALADLQSRFSAAMLLRLQALDEAGQRQVLQLRARSRGLTLPAPTARYLQRRYRRDLPTLCALLDTIDLAALQAQRRLTVPFIRQVLAAEPRPNAE
jgi:DnaA-homolog protein